MIFRIIFIKICHKNGYKFHWKTRGSFLEFALIDVEAGNNCKQCSIYITFRREEQVTWPLAPGFILSTSKESLILRLQCINYKYYFPFSLSWCLFIFGLFVLCYLNVKITRVHVIECSIKKSLTILFWKWKSISYFSAVFHTHKKVREVRNVARQWCWNFKSRAFILHDFFIKYDEICERKFYYLCKSSSFSNRLPVKIRKLLLAAIKNKERRKKAVKAVKTRLVLMTYLVTSSSVVFIVPHSTSINKPSHCWRLHNNRSPKWRWLFVVIYRATK